ncbi:MAG: hypothetical protein COV67_00445 [Nitrospinae bacterium CG11_big_fil_rev_8_21_14_0_20_56_8]|nr:MAG: hypothetical protein COV67_00445 [Nitrospinae bacterium CG11_big_fil_rev_8_21_14_0_20_56_8]
MIEPRPASTYFQGKTVLIAEGTRGLGAHCSAQFYRWGAKVIATESLSPNGDGNSLEDLLGKDGLSHIRVHPADLSEKGEIPALLEKLGATMSRIDFFVSLGLEHGDRKAMDIFDENYFIEDIKTTAWPFFETFLGLINTFETRPSQSLILFEEMAGKRDPDREVTTGMIETLTQYLMTHYLYDNCRINLVKVIHSTEPDALDVTREAAARTVVTLCSGLLDVMSGQTITLDMGRACIQPS